MEYAVYSYTDNIVLVRSNLNADDELILQSFLLRKQAKTQLETGTTGTLATITFATDGDAQDKTVHFGVYAGDSEKPASIVCFIADDSLKLDLFVHELDYVARLTARTHEADAYFDVSKWCSIAIEYLPRVVKLADDKLAELLHTCFCGRRLRIETTDDAVSKLARLDLELFEIACSSADWLDKAAGETQSSNAIPVRFVTDGDSLSLQIEDARKNDFFMDLANQMRTLYGRAKILHRDRLSSASPEKRSPSTFNERPSENAAADKKTGRQLKSSVSSAASDLIMADEKKAARGDQSSLEPEVHTSAAFELKQMVEHARLRIAQDLNTLKRLLALAEASYPDLYRCYQFVRRSPNRDVLCEHVRHYGSLYSEEATQLIELFDECIATPRLEAVSS